MDVAIPITNSVLAVIPADLSSPPLKPSIIIFMPMNPSRISAIHGISFSNHPNQLAIV